MTVSKKFYSISSLILIFLISGCSTSGNLVKDETAAGNSKLLLISFDGFRHDYFSKTDTPSFDQLIEDGVKSEALIPIFPTKTFPNHYAIATGLYPENSGFVGNNMYDSDLGRFTMSNRDAVENPGWYGGEPIWNTAEKQGVKSGTMFWVGSEAPVQNMRPTHWKKYDGSVPDSARIDSVMSWFTAGNSNEIDFATLYFSFVDTQGHRHGPDSEEVIQSIQKADDMIGYLKAQIQKNNLSGKINVIIVSDHGMKEVSRDKVVILDEMINPDEIEIIEGSPSVMANVENGKLEEVYTSLKENEEHFRVYKKEDIPERFHLKNHPRVPELLLIADPGFTITTEAYLEARPNFPSGGAHGFDNRDEAMHGIFLAYGPAFKKGYKMQSVEVIQLYNLFAHLLNIEPAANDGEFSKISEVLK